MGVMLKYRYGMSGCNQYCLFFYVDKSIPRKQDVMNLKQMRI